MEEDKQQNNLQPTDEVTSAKPSVEPEKSSRKIWIIIIIVILVIIISGVLFIFLQQESKKNIHTQKDENQERNITEEKLSKNDYIWKYNTGITQLGTSEIFIQNNILYIHKYRNSYAFNTQTGRKLWEIIDNTPFLIQAQFVSSNYSKNLVFARSYKQINALDALTGREKWKVDISNTWETTVYVTDRVVLFTAGSKYLYAIDINNGNELWRVDTEDEVLNLSYGDGLIFVISFNGPLIAIDELTGEKVWTSTLGDRGGGSPSVGPIYFDNFNKDNIEVIYLASTNNRQIFVLEAKTGDWIYNNREIKSSNFFNPKIINNDLFVKHDKDLCNLNAYNIKKKWCVTTPGGYIAGPYLDDNIVIFSNWDTNETSDYHFPLWDRNIYAVNLKSGEIKWKISENDFSSDLIVNNSSVSFTHDNQIYIFDAETGNEKIKLPITGSFTMDKNNLYLISDKGIVYAINHEPSKKNSLQEKIDDHEEEVYIDVFACKEGYIKVKAADGNEICLPENYEELLQSDKEN